ncbi:stealth family protein [Streptomyces sp. NPDC051567]|uniref:stealth family protein n=1 Tax=Streptomyces sp. NPDC051567 TaxID=3365660 RepID=UPI003788B6C6
MPTPPAPHRPDALHSWPAELPLLVRVYRRAVPPEARRLLARTAPGTLRRLKLPLTRLSTALRRLGAARERRRLHRAGLLTPPGRTVLAVRGRATVVTVSAAPTPLSVRADTLRLVCAALAEADVDHFVVRCHGDLSSAVGVGAADRPRAVAALAVLCARQAGYVSLPDQPHPHPQPSPSQQPHPRLGHRAAVWQALARDPVVRLTRFHTDPSAALVLGPEHGCDIEFWTPDGDRLVAPRPNRTTESVARAGRAVQAPGELFTRLAPVAAEPVAAAPAPTARVSTATEPVRVRTREEFTARLPDEIRFPVDAVYTWVDGADPRWRARRAQVLDEPYHEQAANEARYLSRDELRYSLRSLHLYAPWVRHVHLVTDGQRPDWLAESHPALTVVDHRDVFTDPAALPTFNSHAIESRLHHIDGLSEHFLYFNDDFFLGSPLTPQDFFLANGTTKFFPSEALLPPGSLSVRDVPSSVAGMNNRVLLEDRFGVTVTQKMRHIPYPLRRSVLAEIEREFPEQHRATGRSRLRGVTDLSIPASLHHHYAFLTGRAVPGQLRYNYFDLAQPRTPARLGRLLRARDRQAFCLNDTVTPPAGQPAVPSADVSAFLEAYFPVPGPLERTAAGHRVTPARPSSPVGR